LALEVLFNVASICCWIHCNLSKNCSSFYVIFIFHFDKLSFWVIMRWTVDFKPPLVVFVVRKEVEEQKRIIAIFRHLIFLHCLYLTPSFCLLVDKRFLLFTFPTLKLFLHRMSKRSAFKRIDKSSGDTGSRSSWSCGFSVSIKVFWDQLRRKFPPKQAKLSDLFWYNM